jgi:proline dehydrogenase
MLKKTLLYMSDQPSLKDMAMKFKFARKTARRFVAGDNIHEAIPVVLELNKKGFSATLDFLGEMVNTQEEADQACKEYILALDELNKARANSNVSLKLTQFGLGFDESLCRGNVERVIIRAKELNNFVRIDMEGSPYTEATLRIFSTLRKIHENVGIVIQSYLFRSEKDIENMLALSSRIRLCKGAYKEPPEISFEEKEDTDKNYIKLMKILLKSGIYHGIATHDPKMIDATKQFATQEQIAKESFEFQMLYGIRRDLQDQLIKEGYGVRIYVPYGGEWYSYLMRRMAERPANLMFVLRNVMRG